MFHLAVVYYLVAMFLAFGHIGDNLFEAVTFFLFPAGREQARVSKRAEKLSAGFGAVGVRMPPAAFNYRNRSRIPGNHHDARVIHIIITEQSADFCIYFFRLRVT